MSAEIKRDSAFLYFLDKLESLFKQAAAEENPGLWLYKNDARTPLFMLEALCRIYTHVYGKKPFKKLKNAFKTLEDLIGQVDMDDSIAGEFNQRSGIAGTTRSYLNDKTLLQEAYLNEWLKKENWLDPAGKNFKKCRKKIKKVKWLKAKKEAAAILGFFEITIEEIKTFFETYKYGFTELEDQVHDFRRQLRWLSIYAHALRGGVQLINSGIESTSMDEYITEQTEQSLFNHLPDATGQQYIILMDRKVFLALSALLNQLGIIKDEGLKILLLAEAIQQEKQINSNLALLAAFEALNYDADGLQKILLKATEVCQLFFRDGLPDKLLQGIATNTKN